MQILLINANPVVSRLLFLCTRDSDFILNEVTCVDDIKDISYDLIFVDDGSYVDEVNVFLEEKKGVKRVFITYLNELIESFDESIQKPFLPSQIIKIIESVDRVEVEEIVENSQFIFPLATEKKEEIEEKVAQNISLEIDEVENKYVEELLDISISEVMEETFEPLDDTALKVLDGTEIEKIKALLEMDDVVEELVENLSEDEVQLRKMEVITEQLISEGLEILDEDEIIDELSAETENKPSLKSKKQKKKQQKIENVSSVLEDAVSKALSKLSPKKMKKFLKGKRIKLKIKREDEH